MLTKIKLFSLAIAILISFNAFAAKQGIKVDVQLSPAGSFEITTAKVSGKVKKTDTGYKAKKLSVKVKNFETGMDLRNKHTKEKLQSKKYPTISIRDIKAKNGKGVGTIKIMGKKKKIAFTYKEVASNLLEANFKLSLKNFGIEGISYMGVGVQDEVKVKATIKVAN